MSTKIEATHLQRGATIYLRQSTMKQVVEHRESTLRQYGLRERAIALGFSPESVLVVDEDLGQSGASTESRNGFQRMAEDVAHGRTGAIVALEVSRLARSSADWHRLLELCGRANVVIVDEQAVYNPRDHNDRLLLGLKGTMSEAELYWMRLRLDGGKLSKAQRGQYSFLAAPGYVWDDVKLCFRLDPDEQVQRAVRLVFEEFRARRSAYGVCHALGRQGVQLPLRGVGSRKVVWSAPKHSAINYMLHNPAYAGAYVYGRTEQRQALVDGKVRRRYKRKLEAKDWKVFLKDRHPLHQLGGVHGQPEAMEENRLGNANPARRGAAREGVALLQGLVPVVVVVGG